MHVFLFPESKSGWLVAKFVLLNTRHRMLRLRHVAATVGFGPTVTAWRCSGHAAGRILCEKACCSSQEVFCRTVDLAFAVPALQPVLFRPLTASDGVFPVHQGLHGPRSPFGIHFKDGLRVVPLRLKLGNERGVEA